MQSHIPKGNWLGLLCKSELPTQANVLPILKKGNASRVELCSALSEGGITPSLGLVELVLEECSLPVYVMVRPRAGDFLYSDCEFEVMKRDVTRMKHLNVKGFVFGILCSEGLVDIVRCQELLDICRPKDVTFHRAIDMTSDPLLAMAQIIKLGFERILTSGGESTCPGGGATYTHND